MRIPRQILDGDYVRVYNDVGEYEAKARILPSVRPGQIVVDHAWEPFQFRKQRGHQTLTPSPINPIQLAGGYFHLQPTPLYAEPGASDRGTRIEVEKIPG